MTQINADDAQPNAEEIDEWRERYLRLAADLDNHKKRLAHNYANQAQETQARLLRDMLPFVDNLQRALQHVSPNEARSAFYSGIQLSLKAFLDTLRKHGVEKVDALGEPFDPHVHEAIGSTAHPSLPPGTVVHVEQPGYTYEGRLLRPARVVVVA